MRLLQARIRGFQSFSDSGELDFSEGINLIIGQNNSGKSALLRAFLPSLTDDRHRTPNKWQDEYLERPEVNLKIGASGPEVRDWIIRVGGQTYVPTNQSDERKASKWISELFEISHLQFAVKHFPGQMFSSDFPSHGLFISNGAHSQISALLTPSNGDLRVDLQYNGNDTLVRPVWEAWMRGMFYFAAERMTVGEAPTGYAVRLSPNAANLPNVLHTLSGERGDVFRKLINHLREIFPTVGNISIRIRPDNNNFEVRVWPTESMERVELSFPLNSSGTGVSQVIAILLAIMTSDNTVIIIDEINSFLHPAASKSLLRIIQTQYMNHQYIISTHAPEVISYSNPTTVHLVKRSGYESTVARLSLADIGVFRDVAEHLGVSMSDVFAAERVIWVEGPTEELCFPYLYQRLVGPLPRGTVITSVAATGDFSTSRRNRALVYEIYRRLSKAAATLVVSVVFSFDTEKLTIAQKSELQREAGGRLYFLPRRHLECYLIDPHAIAAFVNAKDLERSDPLSADHIASALKKAAGEGPLHISQWDDDLSKISWLERVDAANLIAVVCGAVSDERVQFNKKNDSLFLIQHILDNNPSQLEPLKDYVELLVEAVNPAEAP